MNKGRFKKGRVPHNKGVLGNPGHTNKGAFKKGHSVNKGRSFHRKSGYKQGWTNRKADSVGNEYVDPHGYVSIIIVEPPSIAVRYVLKHKWLWERKHNKRLPKGMVLKCLDGNKLNTDPSNWEALPRQVMSRLTGN